MTPEAQKTAIAEACGWTNVAPRIVKNVKHQGDDRTVGIWSDNGWIPDYLNDLNAMHEAEKMLKGGMRSKYDAELTLICSRDYNFIWESTASQRAEAFLRTIGKWEESK